ncbi:cyclophilin-like fold protein [Breznakiella homolactica]|uniref:Cyclophilin-like domain-containing protein n=1 Tax=Breznakiella homolactica TaxID=2798577 RepID=A0A7T7XK25_9SPIR|nr:cyclophilin-like fold protein [Breznakiella homolactica]QQO07688.1 hypothetical protein JFL75_12110 [Breznakiella homolactica]
MKLKSLCGIPAALLLLSVLFTSCGSNSGAAEQAAAVPAPASNQAVPAEENSEAAGAACLTITVNGTTVRAPLVESPASQEFLSLLPLTINMTDYRSREKHGPMPALNRDNLTNIQQAYEIGDIIYYPPGPTLAVFYGHDGNVISAGMEVLARLDAEGIAAFASQRGTVQVTIDKERATSRQDGRRLTISLDNSQTISAAVVESPAAEEFLSRLPVSFDMAEHLNRQKEVYLPFSLSESNLLNPVYEYEIGDIVYWHPGPTMGIFHSHDGRSIRAGVEVLARLDAAGVQALASYPGPVKVTFESVN